MNRRRQQLQQKDDEAYLNDLQRQVEQKRRKQEEEARREREEILQHYQNNNVQYVYNVTALFNIHYTCIRQSGDAKFANKANPIRSKLAQPQGALNSNFEEPLPPKKNQMCVLHLQIIMDLHILTAFGSRTKTLDSHKLTILQ